MSDFTHFNQQGRAHMVDISDKQETNRMAIARSSILMNKQVYEAIIGNAIKKGDVLAVAQVAGIMAAKKTPDFIPMCHPLPLTGVNISFQWDTSHDTYELIVDATVKTKGITGVEMEALTAVSAATLTVYDMCKAIDKGMTIGQTFLIEKQGGKSGDYYRKERRNDRGSK